MAFILAIANQKGGVGKTTATYNLAAALAKKDQRVLMVDNDPQGNLTSYSVGEIDESQKTLDEVYLSKSSKPIVKEELLEVSKNIHLIPGDPMLSGVEYFLISRSERESILRSALKNLTSDFDFVLIDNPPSLNLLTVNGLVASDRVLVPVQPEFFSLEGLAQLQSTMDEMKRWHPRIEMLGMFTNMFDERRRLNTDVLKTLQDTYGELVFKTRIHNSVKIAESSGFGKSIIEYAPRSRSAKEYLDLAGEIMENLSV
jgi:chromosome partitioning protein